MENPFVRTPVVAEEGSKQLLPGIHAAIFRANRNRRVRKVTISDGILLQRLMAEYQDDPDKVVIRVYGGFVANSYKYPAPTSVLEAHRAEDGTWDVVGFETEGKRSHGNGALVTVNARAWAETKS